MILIADSGSTKTDWCIIRDGKQSLISTGGINPVIMSEESMNDVIQSELIPKMLTTNCDNNTLTAAEDTDIYFYGAGCTPSHSPHVHSTLLRAFGSDAKIEVNSDMLGAAHALFGNREGIACILGTGSNSCVYDGKKIVENIPPLGFILGDEGSGAVLGKMFLNAIFKGGVSKKISDEYLSANALTMADVIQRVYRGANPNRFLASISLFIAQHLDNEDVRQIVIDNFRAFFRKNVRRYSRPDMSVGIIGSIGFAYKEIIRTIAHEEHIRLDLILKSPMQNLIDYHLHRI